VVEALGKVVAVGDAVAVGDDDGGPGPRFGFLEGFDVWLSLDPMATRATRRNRRRTGPMARSFLLLVCRPRQTWQPRRGGGLDIWPRCWSRLGIRTRTLTFFAGGEDVVEAAEARCRSQPSPPMIQTLLRTRVSATRVELRASAESTVASWAHGCGYARAGR